MSSIKITELRPVGSQLFQDSESFMSELNDEEGKGLKGGMVISQVSLSAGFLGLTEYYAALTDYTGYQGDFAANRNAAIPGENATYSVKTYVI